ncbi:MAG TPA: hypothetical protein VJG30_03385 [Candidatus Nanoarchaeia archaeon]|nr:hypothetical protein [Candidatus Nanoarchaeia archaeon]
MQKKGFVTILTLFVLFLVLGLLIGYFFTSDSGIGKITGAATSTVGNFTANVVSGIACTWSNAALNVSFGGGLAQSLTQGAVYNASKNYEGYIGGGLQILGHNWTLYNVTADSTNTDSVNITMSGRHLQSGANILGITNVTWMSNQTNGNASVASGSQEGHNFTYRGNTTLFEGFNLTLVADSDPKLILRLRNFSNQLTAGSTVWYRFWLMVPGSQVQATYAGNYTQTCTAALT